MANPFSTPQNERSFSALIDAVIMETGRSANILTIVQRANLVIRECQALGLFARDRIEVQAVTDASPYILQRPPYWRSIEAARYMTTCTWVKLKKPGSPQNDYLYYFYAADDYYVFVGNILGETLSYTAYFWSRPFMYYARLAVSDAPLPGGPYSIRKAYFDIETMKWQYLNGTNDGYVDTTGDPDTDAAYKATASHWLLEDWWELIMEGTKAKVFALGDDGDRGKIAYATYKQIQETLRLTIANEAEYASL